MLHTHPRGVYTGHFFKHIGIDISINFVVIFVYPTIFTFYSKCTLYKQPHQTTQV